MTEVNRTSSQSFLRPAEAADDANSFLRTTGTPNLDVGFDVIELPGVGYATVGRQLLETAITGRSQISINIYGPDGTAVASKALTFARSIEAQAVKAAPGGGYYLAAIVKRDGAAAYDLVLAKLDAAFSPIPGQSFVYPTNTTRLAPALNLYKTIGLTIDSDGNLLVTGNSSGEMLLAKFDGATLAPVWAKAIGGSGMDFGAAVLEKADASGYQAFGWTYSYGAGESDIFTVETDAEGAVTGARAVGDAQPQYALSATRNAEGDLVLAGAHGNGSGTYNYNVLFGVLPEGAGAVNMGQFGTALNQEYAAAILQGVDVGGSGLVLSGFAAPGAGSEVDLNGFFTVPSSDLAGLNQYVAVGANSDDKMFSTAVTSDGGVVAVGLTNSFGEAGDEMIAKVGPDLAGMSDCSSLDQVDGSTIPVTPVAYNAVSVTPNVTTLSFGTPTEIALGEEAVATTSSTPCAGGLNVGEIASSLPQALAIDMAYPNPFNRPVSVAYTVAEGISSVNVSISNLKGQKVAQLTVAPEKGGASTFTWTPEASLPAGQYFITLNAGLAVSTTKVVYLK